MKISTQNEWKLMDAIETGGTQFELASAVLEEVLESYFDEPSHWKDLPYNASRILSLLSVVCSLIEDGKAELFKIRDEFSSGKEETYE